MVDKNKLMIELQELLIKTAVKFTDKHKLSIESIKIDCDDTIITENTTIMDSPSMTKVHKLSNAKINREIENG